MKKVLGGLMFILSSLSFGNGYGFDLETGRDMSNPSYKDNRYDDYGINKQTGQTKEYEYRKARERNYYKNQVNSIENDLEFIKFQKAMEQDQDQKDDMYIPNGWGSISELVTSDVKKIKIEGIAETTTNVYYVVVRFNDVWGILDISQSDWEKLWENKIKSVIQFNPKTTIYSGWVPKTDLFKVLRKTIPNVQIVTLATWLKRY